MSGIDEMTFNKEIKCPRHLHKPSYWVIQLRNGRTVFLLTSKYQIGGRWTHTVIYDDRMNKLETTDLDGAISITCSNNCLSNDICRLTAEMEPQLFKRVIRTVRYYLLKEGHGKMRA